MEPYFIGIDIGGTNIKAAVFSKEGKEIAKASCQTPVEVVKDGFHQRDLHIMWAETVKAICSAVEKSGLDKSQIMAAGCTGHGKGLYLWGKDDNPCYFGIPSTDRRAEDIVKAWTEDGTAERAKALNMQSTLACQPVALLAWLKNEEPDVYKNIQWIFEAKDFVRFMLTGKAMAEYTDYSGTSLLNMHTRNYDSRLLDIYGIPEIFECLPPLCEAAQVCGCITEKAAAETGLPEGIPVCGGMFDIDACAVAMDISDPEPICIITGTWSINEYISKTPVTNGQGVNNSIFCLPEYYLIEASSPTSAGNLDWILDTLFGLKTPDYKDIDDKVDSVDPDESHIIFFPFLYGSNAGAVKNAAFWGLHSGHARAHILRAIFEGVAFSHKQHMDCLLAHRDVPPYIRIAGGAANSDVWMQMFSDVLNLPVEVVEGKELGAMGAAMAAAVSAGVYANYKEAASKMVRIRKKFYPQPEIHAKYLKKYEMYVSVLNCMDKA